MPANLTPEYFKAEQWYRTATSNDEKILALERMLAVMPKHKGTDHLKADLRSKLSKLKEQGERKVRGKQKDMFHVPHTGAGQIVLIGTPNSGKSSIVAALTNAKVNVGDFPFATGAPVPGMVRFEDVHIQLVDMPPITADFVAPGQVGTYRYCNVIGIVVDISDKVTQQWDVCIGFLKSRNLVLDNETAAVDQQGNVLARPALCIATKLDIAREESKDKLKKLCEYPYVEVSAQTGKGLDKLAGVFFKMLNIIRVYSKPPGKGPDLNEPFTLPAGSTVIDLARAVHRQLAEKLKFARIWGTDVYDGQNTQLTHILCDKDIVELHFS